MGRAGPQGSHYAAPSHPQGRLQYESNRVESPIKDIGRFNLDYHLNQIQSRSSISTPAGDDGYANYFILHRAFVKGTVNLPARLSLNGRFGFDFYDYSQDGIPNAQSDYRI